MARFKRNITFNIANCCARVALIKRKKNGIAKVWEKVLQFASLSLLMPLLLLFNFSNALCRIFNLKSRQTRVVPFLPIDVVTGNEFVWHLTWVNEGCLRSVSNSFVGVYQTFFPGSVRTVSLRSARVAFEAHW